ncbi:MAG TPA: hypothetical protein VGJ05_09385 [Fimbriiglobus sp.]
MGRSHPIHAFSPGFVLAAITAMFLASASQAQVPYLPGPRLPAPGVLLPHLTSQAILAKPSGKRTTVSIGPRLDTPGIELPDLTATRIVAVSAVELPPSNRTHLPKPQTDASVIPARLPAPGVLRPHVSSRATQATPSVELATVSLGPRLATPGIQLPDLTATRIVTVSANETPPPYRPLDRELVPKPPAAAPVIPVGAAPVPVSADLPPLGFTGPTRIAPRSGSNDEYQTNEDRWRLGFPEWDRYGKGHPWVFDYPYVLGAKWDPYNQNVLKGDFPIYGQNTFLDLTGSTTAVFEGRQVPTATTPFESTARPGQTEFFGRPNQFSYSQLITLSADLFHGDAAFKPVDWRIKLTPAFDVNYLAADELAVVSPDVRAGTTRGRTWTTLQEWFGEYKLFDYSPEYDFVSVRVGSQPFTSDFRGFIFSDTNRGVRLFGTANGNQDQFNLAYFRQQEKDTNSGLNTFEDRNQNIVIANWYHQDFVVPGYTIQGSIHYNNDGPDTLYDKNGFLVRPDPAGVFQPHRVEAAYVGFAGDGHIGRYNISHAFYWALGRDSMNPIAGQPQSISAQMAALELSYDRDYVRFRASGFWASGDGNVNNGKATGFDGIIDNTNFAGETSFWNRQSIGLFGVNLVQRNSLFADLRSSKLQGQSNFVNPGLWLVNLGVDVDVTPRFRVVNNVNFLWFDKTNALEQFVYQSNISRDIGADLSTAVEYRPVLNNNVIITGGVSTLLPTGGFRDLYDKLTGKAGPLVAGFLEITLTF